jgi:ubiquitin C-terminal hydrolase
MNNIRSNIFIICLMVSVLTHAGPANPEQGTSKGSSQESYYARTKGYLWSWVNWGKAKPAKKPNRKWKSDTLQGRLKEFKRQDQQFEAAQKQKPKKPDVTTNDSEDKELQKAIKLSMQAAQELARKQKLDDDQLQEIMQKSLISKRQRAALEKQREFDEFKIIQQAVSLSLKGALKGQGKQLKGLKNYGNTCYLNATLQALISIQPFIDAIKTIKPNTFEDSRTNERLPMTAVDGLIQLVKDSPNAQECERKLLILVNRINQALGRRAGGQQDAVEYLTKILDALSERSINKTQFMQLYMLPFSKQITCNNGHQFFRPDTTELLKVTVPNTKKSVVLQKVIAEYFAPSLLVGNNKYHCSGCSYYVDSQEKVVLEKDKKLSPVLLVQLKRFNTDYKQDKQGNWYGDVTKIKTPVVIPEELKMLAGRKLNKSYKFKAMVLHHGPFGQGHYTAVARRAKAGWYHFNDKVATPMADKELSGLLAKGVFKSGRISDGHPYLLAYVQE